VADSDQQRIVHGPFHRLLSDTQDAAVLAMQLLSGELWGGPGRWGGRPKAKAYRGPLAPGRPGFEFWAFTAPDTVHGAPAYWYEAGDFLLQDSTLEVARLKIAFVKITQSLQAVAP
jgi:hypothetical protein